MVFLAACKTFEMDLVVCFETWGMRSRVMSNWTLVLSFTIVLEEFEFTEESAGRKRSYASGFIEKEHSPSWKMLFRCFALSQGASSNESKDSNNI